MGYYKLGAGCRLGPFKPPIGLTGRGLVAFCILPIIEAPLWNPICLLVLIEGGPAIGGGRPGLCPGGMMYDGAPGMLILAF